MAGHWAANVSQGQRRPGRTPTRAIPALPGTLRRVPSQAIAQNLAFINWTVLTGLALGCYGVVVLARLRTDATRGFLTFTAFCAAGFAVLAWLSDGGLPPTIVDSPVVADPAWDAPRRAAMLLFVAVSIGYLIVVSRRARATPLAILGLLVGLSVLVLGALTWGGSRLDGGLFVVQQGFLAAATGGVFAAMILGHWYLVTPKLHEGPLVLFSRGLLGVMVVLTVLFVAFTATNAGVPGADPGGSAPFSILFGPWALFAWLRLIVGLIFPLVVSWMALQTAKTRSMESATGLLYINVGSVAAGTILAAGVFFGAGLFI
jgi:hypothetical protein